jgi:hypothetical protein
MNKKSPQLRALEKSLQVKSKWLLLQASALDYSYQNNNYCQHQ